MRVREGYLSLTAEFGDAKLCRIGHCSIVFCKTLMHGFLVPEDAPIGCCEDTLF